MSAADALPKPSFDVLVQVLATPCFVHLGLIENPATGKPEKDLDQARWALDLLHVLRDTTAASVTDDEKGRFEALLHQLREAYSAARD